MPPSTPSVKAVFDHALEIESPAEREAYLDAACAKAPDVRHQVEDLLRAYAEAGSFLEPPSPNTPDATAAFVPDAGTVDLPGGDAATGTFDPDPATVAMTGDPDATRTSAVDPEATVAPPNARPFAAATRDLGTVIAGRYTLVEVIGEGGMGSVYLATQSEPVKRQVAVKLIKTGMDSKGVLARFDAERQALAMMDHPSIARIYDGGVTPAGQPFFVMELVKGVPLTEYCDAKRLTVDARLQLFVAVCQAVQHAHQKGIIHRDLKPGNVLVTEVDGRPTPKVIDFGVAKATEQRLTDQSFSDTGAIVGTPTYMSPEQADPSSMDIDTRTDVYALGVMLYELLTGSPPIDSKQFKRGAILEMLRMVREVEPPRPSTRLSEANALPNIAANRSIDPAKLARLLQGELDWVVMKALEKDRTRRYDTANGFARDIQRYLADEVVEARPPSRGYRLKKFVKRNKVQVLAASLVLLALVLGVAGTAWGLMWALDAEKTARLAKGKAEDNALIAKKNEATAVAATGRSRRLLYDVRMGRASEARNDWAFGRLGVALDEAAQADGGPDPRGWEWHYLDRLTRADATRSWESLKDEKTVPGYLRVSPDGKRVAGLSYLSEKTEAYRFEMWDLATGTRLETRATGELKIADSVAVDCVLTADFQSFAGAASASDGRVHLWDVTTGKAVTVTPRKPAEGEEVQLVAVGPKAAWAVLYAHPDNRMPDEPLEQRHQPRFLRWDRGTDRWTTFPIPPAKGADGKALRAEVTSIWHSPTPTSFSMPPLSDGKRLLFHTSWYGPNPKPTTPDRPNPAPDISRWECWDVTADPPEPVFLHESPGERPIEMRVSSNGEWAATLRNGELTVCRAGANLPAVWRHTFPPPDPPDALNVLAAVGNDGNTVVTPAGRNRDISRNAVHLIRVHTRKAGAKPEVRTTDLLSEHSVHEIHLSDDGTRLVAQGDGQCLTWDLTREREFGERPKDPPPLAARPGSLPANGGVADPNRTGGLRWERNGPLLVGRFDEYAPHAGPPKPGQTNAGAKKIRSGIHLQDAADGKHRCTFILDDFEQDRRPANFSTLVDPTHRYLAVPGIRGDMGGNKLFNALDRATAEALSLRVFDTGTGAKLWEKSAYFFEPGDTSVFHSRRKLFTPDGEHLLFASNTISVSRIRFARSSDGEVMKRFDIKWESNYGPDPNGPVMRFSPDGRKLCVRSHQECGVWDVESGAELFRLRGHETSIAGVLFSPDGERLFLRENGVPGVVTGQSPLVSRVHVWDVGTGQRVLVIPVPGDKPQFPEQDKETMWFRDGKLFVLTPAGTRVFDGNPVPDS